VAVPPPRDELAKACRTAQVIGGAMLVSLGIYAVVITLIQQTRAPFAGFAPGVPHGLLRWIFAALAVAGLGLSRVVQRSILGNAALPLLGRLTNAAIVGLALCEAIAVYGFVLFMLAGRPIDYYGFAALALVGFLLYFPRRGLWEEQARTMPSDAAGRGITRPGA
jgi:F0F1-type ATP synthase membrane subunit c/vacuolar-type H+-ATPase subunit K